MSRPAPAKPRVGVSACLLGEEVRYDGAHKRQAFLTDQLGSFVEWIPICPEMEIGLGCPRPPIDLSVDDAGEIALVVRPDTVADSKGKELARRMSTFARARVVELRDAGLDGYILKSRSPSCGLSEVRLHREGEETRGGTGLFARSLTSLWPGLPVFEETDLTTPRERENRVSWLFAYARWRNRGPGLEGVRAFHRAHKIQFRSRGWNDLQLSNQPTDAPARTVELCNAYEAEMEKVFSSALDRAAHARALTQILNGLSGGLTEKDQASFRSRIRELTADSSSESVGSLVGDLRIRSRELGNAFISAQSYLDPHPEELGLLDQI